MDINKIIDNAIELAKQVTGIDTIFKDDMEWYSWPQRWSDTSCGFGGMAGQMFCQSQTVVIRCTIDNEMYVFHAGMFAYHVPESDRFWFHANRHRLPGKIDGKEIMKMKNRVPIEVNA